MAEKNLSKLAGSHRTRVFVGGAYAKNNRALLDLVRSQIKSDGFDPILAEEYKLLSPDRDIHDVTLWLLHACRMAVFEVSVHSGALMELERMRDYGIFNALLLYQHPGGLKWPAYRDAWQSTQMLKSMALELSSHWPRQCIVRPYVRPGDAARELAKFLRAIRRSPYGKLHNL